MLPEELRRGVVTRNPLFVMGIGLCPAIAVTSTALASLVAGLSIMAVLIVSNILVSLTRKAISRKARLPVYLAFSVGAASAVSAAVYHFAPSYAGTLAMILPFVMVNALVLERADSCASQNTVLRSAVDALAMGLGLAAALLPIGIIREIFSTGTLFGLTCFPHLPPVRALLLAPGGFLITAGVLAILRIVRFGSPKIEPAKSNRETSILKVLERR